MYSGGAAQSAPALNGSIKKAPVPASHALHKDGGFETSVVPPWFTASSRTLPQNCGRIFSAYSRTL